MDINEGHKIVVEAQDDHLRRVAGSDPLLGLDELIWNSLDADANRVDITLDRNELGGLKRIVVEDDGVGFSHEDAHRSFKSLGGSAKFGAFKTPTGRMLHGQKGEGRYRSLALGATIIWTSTYRHGGDLKQFELQMTAGSLGTPLLGNAEYTQRPSTGCRVEVLDVSDRAEEALSTEVPWLLASRFASYLLANPSVRIYVDGETVDVTSAVVNRITDDLSFDRGEKHVKANISTFFWNSGKLNELFLCRGDGVAVEQVKHVVNEPSLSYTAYVSSDYFSSDGDQPYSDLGSLDDIAEEIRKKGRRQLRAHVRQVLAEQAKETIKDLEKKGAYPFEGTPKTDMEKVEREVFDIVASKIYELSPSVQQLKSDDLREKFSIVKEVIGDEGVLNRVVQKLFRLDNDSLRDLDMLTDRHGFQRMISLTRQSEHRIEFLEALHYVVYDPDTRDRVLERSQLQKIIEREAWVFGEQYRLLGSEQSLWTVLEAHSKELGREKLLNEVIVQDDINMDEIPDLFFAGSIPGSNDGEREHLVVELKRPNLNLGNTEIDQIQAYADAVATHAGFDTDLTKWKFILIGGDIQDQTIRRRLSDVGKPPGLLYETSTYQIFVYKWSTVIQTAKSRMRFVHDLMSYDVSKKRIKEHLLENHADVADKNRTSPSMGDMLRDGKESG